MEQAQYNIRARIGKLSGAVGIICNCLLAAGKLIVGHMTSSMSITADGLNNLSDGASSIVTLLGFKLAEKPADRKHPYGHARIEYIAGLTVAVMILFIGLELGKSSVEKFIDPEPIEFSIAAAWVLCASILVKLFMMLFNLKMGRRINSNALLATAADSRNDVMTTSAVLAASIVEHFYDVRIDGVMGIAVSLFILYSGIKLAGETMSPLLGEGANPELQKQITDYINGCPMVLGCHDLMVHDYGPGRVMISLHAEVPAHGDILTLHDEIDNVEKQLHDKLGCEAVIHMDPIVTNDEAVNVTHQRIAALVRGIDENISIHDFRMVTGPTHTNVIFDAVVPYGCKMSDREAEEKIKRAVHELDPRYFAIVQIDKSYVR